MSDKEEYKSEKQNGLDISEYIPGYDLKHTPAEPSKTREERISERRWRRIRRKLAVGLAAFILSIPMLWIRANCAGMPTVMQYVFLYFIFEAILAENWYTQLLSLGMLLCYGLLMSGLLDVIEFNTIALLALGIFLWKERNPWLLAMNILVFGTWTILTVLALFYPRILSPR